MVCRWLSARTGVGELLLVARQQQPLLDLQKELGGGRILTLEEALPEADVVVWVASMPRTLQIDQDSLRSPCLMIDGGYPKNLDAKVAGGGIHVLKGGIVEFCRDIGWTDEIAEMETAAADVRLLRGGNAARVRALPHQLQLGRNNITLEKMDFIGAASVRHGFSTLNLSPGSGCCC